MSISETSPVLSDAESETALFLRSALVTADVRTDLSTWDGTTAVVHVHRVGGSRDRFIDRARIAVDCHDVDRDTAFGVANTARALLLSWPALTGVCSASSEELGPTSLPVESELPVVAMTWGVSVR